MYSYKKIISILKKDWLDYILLLFLSILLVLIAHSFSIIVLEFNDSVNSEEEVSEIILLQGKNFHNGLPSDDGEE
ncbi:MAG: hypothetical protein VXA09_01485 [Burkholderiaceae bacterium]